MIWIIRLFLLTYAVLYFGIGAWAMIDHVRDALELSDVPSFMKAVGLQVTDEIGYSEVAGLYGGINMVIGLLCFLALYFVNFLKIEGALSHIYFVYSYQKQWQSERLRSA